jgi:hypothetical protein
MKSPCAILKGPFDINRVVAEYGLGFGTAARIYKGAMPRTIDVRWLRVTPKQYRETGKG